MSQPGILNRVVGALTSAGIPHMLTGSVVSSLQGEPRATHDVDVVVQLTENMIARLLRLFREPDYYLDEAAVRDAVARRDMFSLIDMQTADKVDFWVLGDDPYDQARFGRRHHEPLGELQVTVSRPEDTILGKLRWAQLCGGSERQFRDALRVYEVQFDRLDLAYMQDWAGRLAILELWDRLQAEARVPGAGSPP